VEDNVKIDLDTIHQNGMPVVYDRSCSVCKRSIFSRIYQMGADTLLYNLRICQYTLNL
jgi:hypothetical protein